MSFRWRILPIGLIVNCSLSTCLMKRLRHDSEIFPQLIDCTRKSVCQNVDNLCMPWVKKGDKTLVIIEQLLFSWAREPKH